MVLEVMGRDAGHIALAAGIAGGADVILIPEIPYTMEAICAKVEERRRQGRSFSIVVVAESVRGPAGETITYMDAHGQSRYGGIGALIAQEIAVRTGAETRVTVLGHVQRGGAPAPLDRVLASAFGVYAVDLVAAGSPRPSRTITPSIRTMPWCTPRVASASPSATSSGGTERSPCAACSPTSAAPMPVSR
jgi:6-phosphofructokinase 1